MELNPRVDLSVIVPTWNRHQLLRELILSMERQSFPHDRFELIIVDNCSTDRTSDMIAELKPTLTFELNYIRATDNGGPVRSRNTGAKLAVGELFAFTDSDCAAPKDWLATLWHLHQSNPGVGLICGPTINKPNQTMKFFSIGAVGAEGENPIYPTCNIAYPRIVFEALGGFDPAKYLFDLGNAPVEFSDVEFAWRVKDAGYLALFDSRMIMHHEVRHETPYNWLMANWRVVGLPALAKRYPPLCKSLIWLYPFCRPENLLFYVLFAGLLLGLAVHSAFLLLGLPFFWRFASLMHTQFSPLRLPVYAAQMVFVFLRQSIICSGLLVGSVKARFIVL